MSNTEKQDIAPAENNTIESRLSFADKAEKLLRTILVALGYENAGTLRGEDLITGITAWVTLLISMKQDPGGSYASFWARAFFEAWSHTSSEKAAEAATNAVNEFAKRYPPMLNDAVIDEQERDTQSDIQVLTAELDKQVQLVWQLESELATIRKLNEHHASELATERTAFEAFKDSVRAALGVGDGVNMIAIIEARTKQHREYHDVKSNALVPLAKPERIELGQRWAIVMVAQEQKEQYALFEDSSGCGYAAYPADLEPSFYLGTDKV